METHGRFWAPWNNCARGLALVFKEVGLVWLPSLRVNQLAQRMQHQRAQQAQQSQTLKCTNAGSSTVPRSTVRPKTLTRPNNIRITEHMELESTNLPTTT